MAGGQRPSLSNGRGGFALPEAVIGPVAPGGLRGKIPPPSCLLQVGGFPCRRA